MEQKSILKHVCLLSLAGSKAYGTDIEGSDSDYKGIFIAPSKYYFGFSNIEQSQNFESFEYQGIPLTRDTEFFELRRFFQLAIQNNPAMLDVIYSPDMRYLDYLEPLIENRDLFLSKRAKFSFGGYAAQQMKKINSHRKWLLDPPTKKPEIADFDIPQGYELTKSELYPFFEYLYQLINLRLDYCENSEILKVEFIHLLKETVDLKQILRTTLLPEVVLEYSAEMAGTTKEFATLLQRVKAYYNALDQWNSYCAWKENRNKERAKLESVLGYDTKHASHCLRLLTMGVEILTEKTVIVDRRVTGDNIFFRDIRTGKYEYAEVMEFVSKKEIELNEVYETSSLPKTPLYDDLEDLCTSIAIRYMTSSKGEWNNITVMR